jgi:hypothetical protein
MYKKFYLLIIVLTIKQSMQHIHTMMCEFQL